MTDSSVRAALRSDLPLVVVEAPAGCGKTHQGADYAQELTKAASVGRALIVTHTHAACSVFADRTAGARNIDIRTIDSVIASIGTAYRTSLGIPEDVTTWTRRTKDGYAMLAQKVALLLKRHPMIAAAMARRHPVIICDEHQDSSGNQHAVVMAMLDQGAKLRVFGDPMQKIFPEKHLPESCKPCAWDELRIVADSCEELTVPHRWGVEDAALGAWTLTARQKLLSEQPIDLRGGLPPGVEVVLAENLAERNLGYSLSAVDRLRVDHFERLHPSLLILTRHNFTARSLRAFFNRRIPLWEGHTRTALDDLAKAIATCCGDSAALAVAVVEFMTAVGKGFTKSAFGNVLVRETRNGCVKAGKGKSATLQLLAQCLLDDATHRGVAKVLAKIAELRQTDPAFSDIEIDRHREFGDAIRMGSFDSPEAGIAEITHRRTYSHPQPPSKAISNIHMAKGLECDAVIVMPCDATTFPSKTDARCLLYVALSRARKRLLLVVSRRNPSPLFVT